MKNIFLFIYIYIALCCAPIIHAENWDFDGRFPGTSRSFAGIPVENIYISTKASSVMYAGDIMERVSSTAFWQGTPVEWITIPAGKLWMGSGEFLDTKPIHEVSITTFDISKTLVTVEQFSECVHKGKCRVPVLQAAYATIRECNWNVPGRKKHPMNCIDRQSAIEFAEYMGGRLPTEAEWEYAATSGGKKHSYPWGNSAPSEDLVVCGIDVTRAVCSKPAGNTEHGLCDMTGNVMQIIQDKYWSSYNGAPTDGGPVTGEISASGEGSVCAETNLGRVG